MRVCQPGPVAFQRAKVSGDKRRLIAIFDCGDFGRPRGFSIAAATRAPKIFGKTSFAGRASAIIFAVHSGLSRRFFSVLDCFFIPFYLSVIGFTQTDDTGLAIARRKYHAVQTTFNQAKHAVAPFPIIFTHIFPNQGA